MDSKVQKVIFSIFLHDEESVGSSAKNFTCANVRFTCVKVQFTCGNQTFTRANLDSTRACHFSDTFLPLSLQFK